MNPAFLSLVFVTSPAIPVAHITLDITHRMPISPFIYGVNYPDSLIQDWLKAWGNNPAGFTLAREGGNRFTAYNWETNASNAGNDYHFENDDYLGVSDEAGWTVSQFLKRVQPSGAAVLLTVPTLGFVSADKSTTRDGGMDVNHTPDWIHQRFVPSYAHKPGGQFVYPPDTTDHAVYEDEFVHWVESIKSNESPVWFSLDNEPDLWHSTHLRIEPQEPTYARIIANNLEYARAIKAVAPEATLFGPSNYGWAGFRGFQGAKDAAGRIFVDAYLDAFKAASTEAGKRLLDVYDFHWYPENKGDGVRIIWYPKPDTAATAAARIQAPRSLWDPAFVEDTWITKSIGNKPIRLLPDMRARVEAHYPGTKLSISEYDFGGRKTASGAIAQADALGIFGRFGLFAACQWGLTQADSAAWAAFEAFTNFDRKGSRFGDFGLAVLGESPEANSVYAATDSKNPQRLTMVVINKLSTPQQFAITTSTVHLEKLKGYRIETGHFDVPTEVHALALRGRLAYIAPPLSVTTFTALQ